MIDSNSDVMTTFSDFSENSEMSFGEDLNLPQDCLLNLVVRGDERIVPNGNTIIEKGDVLVILKRS